MYWVYLIKSESTGRCYIGQTNNLTDRIERHNSGRSRYTKNKGPWQLIASLNVNTRSEAMRLEKKLKDFKNFRKALEYLQELKKTEVSYNNRGSSRRVGIGPTK